MPDESDSQEPHNAESVEDLTMILDTYWPVIEHVRAVRAHYLGNADGQPKVMPDHLAPLMEALAAAESACMVTKTED